MNLDVKDTTTAGLALEHLALEKPPLHIPNAAGEPYKTELVLYRSPDQTVKVNFWHLPDDDRSPHNHPWRFVSEILHGGYEEKRFWVEDGVVKSEECAYSRGDTNVVDTNIFHLVTKVEPGTVTRMTCGKASDGNEWGYLDVNSGTYTPAEPDPTFLERLRANNRFLIKK